MKYIKMFESFEPKYLVFNHNIEIEESDSSEGFTIHSNTPYEIVMMNDKVIHIIVGDKRMTFTNLDEIPKDVRDFKILTAEQAKPYFDINKFNI